MAVFRTLKVNGPEGSVRGLFSNRQLDGAASAKQFPGIASVAILPKVFSEQETAHQFLEEITESGGNAAAVRYSDNDWLIGGWAED